MVHKGLFVVLLTLIVMLSGCSQTTDMNSVDATPIPINKSLYPDEFAANVSSYETLFTLSPAQYDDIERFIQRPDIAPLAPFLQVQRYLVDTLTDFHYEGQSLNAADALMLNSGNCMSMAAVSYAVSKALKVPIQFQMVQSEPVLLDVTNNTMIISDHVRTLLYNAPEDAEFLSPYWGGHQFATIDYFPSATSLAGRLVDAATFVAMFYRNLASDALVEGRLGDAYWLVREGVKWAPEYVPLLNVAAIVHRRSGDWRSAEALYQHALEIEPDNLAVLDNYRALAQLEGNTGLADTLKKRIAQVEDYRGFDFYVLGHEALQQGNYNEAEMYFSKLLKNAPYFHPGWFELAKAQAVQGKFDMAKQALEQALALSSRSEDSRRYQAKLSSFK